MLGYESYVLLNGTIIPAISADTSEDRTRIDSSGVYGGGIEINTPLSSPHFYDWPAITGNVTFEASKETLNVVKNMIFHRNTPFGIKIITRIAGEQEVKKAWWNSISIQASEDSIVNITISFVGIERNSFAVGTFNGYWENVEGLYGSFCFNPIPFWKTKINGMENVRGWTFTLTQDVTRFLGCMNFSGNVPKNPYILGIGVLACDMKIQTLPPDNYVEDIWAMPETFSGSSVISSRTPLSIILDNYSLINLKGELVQVSDPVQGGSNIANLDWSYQIFEFSE